jgi:hypothetical protein
LLLVVIQLARQGSVRQLFSRPYLLLWGWIGAACFGPLLFDLLRHTTTSEIPRYVVPGLPAAVLLAGLGMSRLSPGLHLAILSAMVLAWLPASRSAVLARTPRPSQPYQRLDGRLESWARPGDLVVVHSNPSGVIGVARYLRRDLPLASWVARLGIREIPGDLELLLGGRRRVALVKIHHLGTPSPPEDWLRAHARLLGHETFRWSSAEVLYFEPRDGEAFFPGASGIANRSASGR